MREISIKYNPYKVETEIKIDKNLVPTNSALNFEDKRFQERVEELPKLLLKECNTNKFSIAFHGTLLDYEDLISTVEDANKNGITDENGEHIDINIECTHIPAKEVHDKEKSIKEIFKDIQKGPFDELKQADVIKAFELATKSEFEVNVIATMSAGKSTLINALLSKKLMPSKNESCTATVSKIKDTDDETFVAKVYDKSQNLIEVESELCYETMQDLNSNEEVSTIEIEGNIPFVSSEDMSLVLVDTPGPNNSRDENHKETTYRMLSESSKTLVLYVLNATQLAVDDDNSLLNNVAESMKVGGKQSKDRFIFVVNKIDTFKKGEDSVEESLKKVKKYLEDKGIKNPNIFPAAALPALDIRTYLNDDTKDEEYFEDEIYPQIRKLIRNKEKHLENYAPLTPSLKNKITDELAVSIDNENEFTEALIHTGIKSIEEYINMYVEKYAHTAKIKNIVDTFDKKLQTAKSFENSKQEIAENEDKHKEILERISIIKEKINDGQEAEKFKEKIGQINFKEQIANEIENITEEAQNRITGIQEKAEKKVAKTTMKYKIEEYRVFSKNLESEIKVKLENTINHNVTKNAYALLEEYRNKIGSLINDLTTCDVKIEPFALIEGNLETLKNYDDLINKFTSIEREKIGEKWVENTDKKWYKPWTWLDEDGYYKDVYENKEYVNLTEVSLRFFAPIQNGLLNNALQANKACTERSEIVKNCFIEQFKEIDEVLKAKLTELEQIATNKEVVEEAIKKSKENLEWLEGIQHRVQNILEI